MRPRNPFHASSDLSSSAKSRDPKGHHHVIIFSYSLPKVLLFLLLLFILGKVLTPFMQLSSVPIARGGDEPFRSMTLVPSSLDQAHH